MTNAYTRLFGRASDQEVAQLVGHPDCRVALLAAWERTRRQLPLIDRPRPLEDPEIAALQRFVGVIEGRLGADVPDWWERSLENAKLHPHRHLMIPPREWGAGFGSDSDAADRAKAPEPAVVVTGREEIHVRHDGKSWPFPPELVSNLQDRGTAVADDGRVFVAVHSGLPVSFNLLALDWEAGEVVWQARVFAQGPDGGGPDVDHGISIKVKDRMVIVFGVHPYSAYVEAFDRETGAAICRVGTWYSFDLERPDVPDGEP